MNPEPSVSVPVFDSHAGDYESQCMRGLAVSRESIEYFARGRLRYLRDAWDGRGLPEPHLVIDYGCGVGDVTRLIAETFPRARVVGLDPSPACVERAGRFAGPRVSFAVAGNLSSEELDRASSYT